MSAHQRTLSIIKPDATARNVTGSINSRFEQAGLRVIAQKRMHLTKTQAEKFYEVHNDKAFYESLCEYMSSGPVVAQVLSGDNAVAKNREIMGATNPANAEIGTIRRDFGQSIEHNAVHGSDCVENAEIEIAFFFSGLELVG
ncbi:nucleoside diphosphate kinase [Alphaproteobacteria bacterium]|nr:nucleoside diphosphate kinase [Alphaproteobacteria bacterium]